MQATPYDILGVRPGANGDEVEHAYRARRSQYHPDRYNQSDEATQAWATEKMQEVTAAYRAITEGTAFSGAAASRTTASPPPVPEVRKADLEQLLRDNARTIVGDKIFLAPNIPPRKLDGALGTYGGGVRPSDILVVVDNTVFGSAKDGLILTREGIRYRENPMSEVGNFSYADIETAQVDKHTLYINGRKQCWLNLPDSQEFTALFEVVQEYLSGNSTTPATPSSSDAPESARILSLWLAISREAAESFRERSEGDELNIGRLFVGIESAMGRHFSDLIDTARRVSRSTGRRVDAIAIERALLASLALAGHGFSTIPSAARKGFGDEFFQLIGLVSIYAEEFADAYQRQIGVALSASEDERDFLMAAFAQDDESWEAHMNVSRNEAILEAMKEQGYSRNAAMDIVASSERSFSGWFKAMLSHLFNQAN